MGSWSISTSSLCTWPHLVPFLRNLQEFRTLFRPNTALWTHLSTNERQFGPLPRHNPAVGDLCDAIKVQDGTWYLPDSSDPYVQQESSYFTKYTFADVWRDHRVHGLFSDGSTSADGSTFGAWFVMGTRGTYFGGSTHSDLTVDGNVYNYMVSNHHGAQTPNMTDGFDRTFGPGYYYFNKGPADASLDNLRTDALKTIDDLHRTAFYYSIVQYVPNYVPPSRRGNGVDYQDNALDTEAFQYFQEIDTPSSSFSITGVATGLYRLTIYAHGIFGQYEEDNIQISAGKTNSVQVHWARESSGTELWRIGMPDKSAGEYLHGYEPDRTHPLHPEEHRIFWGAYDFVEDFPKGVTYVVGVSDVGEDMNYIHWNIFWGRGYPPRPQPQHAEALVNNWTILFDLEKDALSDKEEATFTVQLAGAETGTGDADVVSTTQRDSGLSYLVVVNAKELEPWTIPHYQSSSCGVRSAVTCYNLAHKFVFDAASLVEGTNKIVLSLLHTTKKHASVYVQYDALRLEVQ